MTTTRSRRRGALFVSAVGLAAIAPGPFAHAANTDVPPQDAEPMDRGNVQEIIVTATRRNEALSQVPISISAYTQETMDNQGVRTITDIARLTPGLRITESSANIVGYQSNVSIRGIASGVGAATTGIYINDTPIQVRAVGNVASNAYPTVFDLERVEVLRGPQGTLFGAGAEGGAVRFITPKPSLTKSDFYGRVDTSFTEGGDPSYEAGAAIGAPVVDGTLGYRLSASYRKAGGWVDRVDPDTLSSVEANANSEEDATGRLAFTWQPIESLTISPSVFYERQQYNDRSAYYEELSDPDAGNFKSGKTLRQPYDDKYVLPALDIDWNLGAVDLVSSTSYFKRTTEQVGDFTNSTSALLFGSPDPIIDGFLERGRYKDEQENWTQELRLQSSDQAARLQWVVGAYYAKSKQSSQQANESPTLEQALQEVLAIGVEDFFGVPLYRGLYSFNTLRTGDDEQKALYGQVDFQVVEGVKLTAGARYSRTEFTFERLANGPIAGGSSASSGSQSESPFTPKVGVSWQIDADNLVYASVAEGYRMGGANLPVSSFCASSLADLGITGTPSTYDSDRTLSYEIGSKNALGRLQLDGSIYYIKWQDIQRSIPLSGCGSSFVANFGDATSTGVDLTAQLQATDTLTIGASLGYTDATLDDTLRGTGTITLGAAGDSITTGPQWTGALSLDQRFTVASWDAFVRADYQYQGAGQSADPRTFGYDPALLPSESFGLLALRLGVDLRGYELSAYVNNALDASPRLSRAHDTATSPLFYQTTLRPRTFGVTAAVRF